MLSFFFGIYVAYKVDLAHENGIYEYSRMFDMYEAALLLVLLPVVLGCMLSILSWDFPDRHNGWTLVRGARSLMYLKLFLWKELIQKMETAVQNETRKSRS